MKRAALYARVSTAAQADDDRNSLPVQRSLYETHCAAQGYDPATIYVDVMSGAKADRPEYQRMLEDARRKRFDVLVVSYLDRLGRDDWETMAAIGELRRHRVTVEATQETAERFLDVALSAWKAAEERQRISARVSLTMSAAAARGIALGRPPYGYVKAWDSSRSGRPINHRLVIDEPQAEWVRKAFNWYARENVSLREIALRFSESSPPKPNGSRHWFPEEIRKLLVRRRYLGEQTWKGYAASGAHEAIVGAEIFEAVQARLAVKATLPPGGVQMSVYLLSGLLRCSHCGGPMHGSATRARPEQRRHVTTRLYICSRHQKRQGCEYPNNHEAGGVERAVIAVLSTLAGDIEAVEQTVADTAERQRARLIEIGRTLERLESRFLRNLELFERGAIASESQLATANAALDEERRRLGNERDALEASLTSDEERRTIVEQMPARVRTLVEQLDALPVAEAKALLQQLVSRVTIGEDEAPRITLRVP